MAEKRITDLTTAATLIGDELLEVSQISTAVTITAATLSAANSDNSFNDSGSGFVAAGFLTGDRVKVTGFTTGDNNLFVGTLTDVTAGKLTLAGTDGDVILDEAAGNTVTITKWLSRRATAQEIADLYVESNQIPLATKGDLLTYDTADAVLAVGADTYVLTADSAEATGLKWVAPAAAPAFSGCLLSHSTTQSITSTIAALTWNTEDYDVGGWHDTGSNPTRITVPSGVSYVRFSCNIFDADSVTGQFGMYLYKNGSNSFAGACAAETDTSGGDSVSMVSPVVPVTTGDYFELWAFATSSRTTDADKRTNFSIEKVS